MEELALITRKEVMQILGFRSLHGFNYFLQKHPDFPKSVERSKSFSGRVCYFKKEIETYLSKTLRPED